MWVGWGGGGRRRMVEEVMCESAERIAGEMLAGKLAKEMTGKHAREIVARERLTVEARRRRGTCVSE